MSKELISELSKLELQRKSIIRNLDKYYYDYKLRTKLFYDLKEVENDIKKVKFKLKLEKEKKNENNNTN